MVCVQVTAKKLDRRLAGLGASELVVRGLGDDQVRCVCLVCCACLGAQTSTPFAALCMAPSAVRGLKNGLGTI